jgi:Transglycosylase SLT domain
MKKVGLSIGTAILLAIVFIGWWGSSLSERGTTGTVSMAESNNIAKAVSHRGARGLMRLMPATAEWLGVHDAFDPACNIDRGVRYSSSAMLPVKRPVSWCQADRKTVIYDHRLNMTFICST